MPAAPPRALRILSHARTDAGKKRRRNEDAFLADPALGLFAVADGMGSHAGGTVAAEMAIEGLARAAGSAPDAAFMLDPTLAHRQRLLGWIEHTVHLVNAAIHERAGREPELQGMGTTLDLALVRGRSVFLAHVGNGRSYVLRGGVLHALTDDHTLEQLLISRGTSTPVEAAAHPQGKVLTRALGVYPDVQVDLAFYDLAAGDVFLLCSDGLHGAITAGEIRDLLAADPARAPGALVEAALDAGGRDNVTAVVFAVEQGAFVERPIIGSETTRLALAGSPLFADFTVGELLRVQRIAMARSVAPGGVLVEQDQIPDALYLILDGRLDVLRDGQPIGVLEEGDPCGEYALVNMPSVVTMRAAIPTQLLGFPRAEVQGLLASDPTIAAKLAFATVARLASRIGGLAGSLARYRGAERGS